NNRQILRFCLLFFGKGSFFMAISSQYYTLTKLRDDFSPDLLFEDQDLQELYKKVHNQFNTFIINHEYLWSTYDSLKELVPQFIADPTSEKLSRISEEILLAQEIIDDEREINIRENQNLKQQIEKLTTQLEEARQQQASSTDPLSNADSLQQIENLTAQLAKAQRQLEEARQQLEETKTNLSHKEDDLRILQHDFTALQETTSKHVSESFNDTINELITRTKNQATEISNLTVELGNLQKYKQKHSYKFNKLDWVLTALTAGIYAILRLVSIGILAIRRS
ncbi:MAG: hypothetical protein JW769_01250, partial [Parachlamydiales bacterium]|nr:hypothetical protein [Parachlamydiales bacterium]